MMCGTSYEREYYGLDDADAVVLGLHNLLGHSFISLDSKCSRCGTNKYFQIIGSIHDIESYFGLDNTSSLNVQFYAVG